ncbi:MAG: AAA family ATPase, partial [Anaerolineales bacterium]
MLRASADLQIYLLGDVQIEYQGKLLPFPRRESLLRLFARLILTAGKPQSRKKLAFSLWSDVDEASALANLRRHLHLIRQFLPEEARSILQISTQEVRWVDDPLCWVDVFAFEHTCADPRAQAQAAELYRGELLSGVDDDEVILARRDELHRLYVSLLKKLSEAALLSGQPETAVHWSRKLLQADPWDEESLRLNMTARAQSGNRQAALETYQNFARDLSRELDAQPMPETMTLYSDILHNRLARSAPPQKVAAPLFVSRNDELAQLQGLFHNLVNGQGRVVFISGQAGVGKTTLLQEALRRFLEGGRDDAPRVLWGSCPPPVLDAPARPYAPWRQILNAAAPLLARSEDISPEWLNRLLPLVPDLALLRPGLLIATQPNAAEMRAALRQAFHALALFKPLVLILEDIHWADDDSLDVLQELAETCQSLPLLILSTHRLDEVPLRLLQAKRAMRQRRCVLEILLMAFSDEEVRQFLDAMLGGQAVSPALYDEIAHYAQGLPLLLREAAESVSRAHDRRPTLPSLRDTIALRLEQLNERAHQMLEAAAVLGFSFPDRELALLLDWPES